MQNSNQKKIIFFFFVHTHEEGVEATTRTTNKITIEIEYPRTWQGRTKLFIIPS